MNDKFSIRHLAFSMVPLLKEEEAAQAISKVAEQHNLDDGQMLELIKQLNVANQYHSFKQANFQVSVDSIDVPTLDPAKVFKALNKVAAFEIKNKKTVGFLDLKSSGKVKKVASLNMPEIKENKYMSFLKELVKQADLDDVEAKVACIKLKDEVKTECKQVKMAFFSTIKKMEEQIAPYKSFHKKFAHLIDTEQFRDPGSTERIPSAQKLIEVNATIEKLAKLTEDYSKLNSMLHILERR